MPIASRLAKLDALRTGLDVANVVDVLSFYFGYWSSVEPARGHRVVRRTRRGGGWRTRRAVETDLPEADGEVSELQPVQVPLFGADRRAGATATVTERGRQTVRAPGVDPRRSRHGWLGRPRHDHAAAPCGAPRTRLERHLESVGRDGDRRVLGDETGATVPIGLHGAERGPRRPVPHPCLIRLAAGAGGNLENVTTAIATPGRAAVAGVRLLGTFRQPRRGAGSRCRSRSPSRARDRSAPWSHAPTGSGCRAQPGGRARRAPPHCGRSVLRRRWRPERMRVLAVPRGTPISVATCACVRSSTKARRSASRCGGGSSSSADSRRARRCCCQVASAGPGRPQGGPRARDPRDRARSPAGGSGDGARSGGGSARSEAPTRGRCPARDRTVPRCARRPGRRPARGLRRRRGRASEAARREDQSGEATVEQPERLRGAIGDLAHQLRVAGRVFRRWHPPLVRSRQRTSLLRGGASQATRSTHLSSSLLHRAKPSGLPPPESHPNRGCRVETAEGEQPMNSQEHRRQEEREAPRRRCLSRARHPHDRGRAPAPELRRRVVASAGEQVLRLRVRTVMRRPNERSGDMIKSTWTWVLHPPVTGPRATIVVRMMAGAVFFWEGILKFVYANQGVGRFTKLGFPFPPSPRTSWAGWKSSAACC